MKYGLSYTLITRTTGALSRSIFHFRKTELDYVCEYIQKQNNVRVLDYGCNTGYYVKHLEKKCKGTDMVFCGADINKYALEYARGKHKEFNFYNVNDDFFRNEKFDIITTSHVIEHIKDYKETVKKLTGMLKKNGVLIITIPQERLRGDATVFQLLYNILRLRFENPHVIKLSYDELRKTMEDCGLKVIDKIYTNYFFPFRSKKRRIDAWSVVVIGKLESHN